jgi:hypothetical protein
MRLAYLKAKPDANHANAHPISAWSCQICNQPRATSPTRGSGFKPDTTRTNLARTAVTGFSFIMAAIRLAGLVQPHWHNKFQLIETLIWRFTIKGLARIL